METPIKIQTSRGNRIIVDGADVATVGEVGPDFCSRVREMSFYVEFSPGVSGGQVVFEAAARLDYTGTWANLATVTATAGGRVHHVAVTGVHLAIRARIAQAILGGSVNVYAIGN